MTSTVALDPLDFEAAAGNFHQIQLNAVMRLGSLSRELRQYDNMAGTDSGGQAFATEYDANAMSIVQALDYLAIRASEFDAGLTATAAAHDLAEQWAAGNVAAASSFTPRPVFAGENPSPPPSAFGGDPTPPPEPWGTVKDFIGAMWPDANIDTLNRAAATWRRIGDNLDEVAREVRRADDPLAATRSGEIAAIRTRVTELADTIALIARDADEVGASCEEYAAIVHAAHEEVFAMLRQLAIEIIAGIGIGVALSFFTFGAAGAAATGVLAARIVSVAARITQTILKVLSFAQKAAGRFAAVHGRLVAAVARLSPRSQTFIRVGNQVGAETTAAVFSEGFVRGENANYLSAFAGGFVGAGTTAGVLSIFGRRADTVFANVVGGTAGGFTGSLAATGVTGNISVENLIMGTVMGTAGGTLGGGGSARSGTDVNAPTPTGQQAAPPPSSPSGGGSKPPLGEAPAAGGPGNSSESHGAPTSAATGGSTSTGGGAQTSGTPTSTAQAAGGIPPGGGTPPGTSQVDLTVNGVRPEGTTTGKGDSADGAGDSSGVGDSSTGARDSTGSSPDGGATQPHGSDGAPNGEDAVVPSHDGPTSTPDGTPTSPDGAGDSPGTPDSPSAPDGSSPDGTTPGDLPPSQPPFDIDDRSTWPWDFTDPAQVFAHGFHNMDSGTAMLGKWDDGAPTGYARVAEANGYAYFELETVNGIDYWKAVQDANGLSGTDMFDSVNAVFLDEIIGARMDIEFSHSPIGDEATLGAEFAYLGAEKPIGGYEWLPNNGMNGRMEPMW